MNRNAGKFKDRAKQSCVNYIVLFLSFISTVKVKVIS